MIAATLAGEKFLLETIEDAHSLLDILARSKRLERHYLYSGRELYSVKQNCEQIAINIVTSIDIVEHEQALELIDADRASRKERGNEQA